MPDTKIISAYIRNIYPQLFSNEKVIAEFILEQPDSFLSLPTAKLAEKMGVDPVVLREKNLVKEGQVMPAYYGETAQSCALDRCLERAKEMIGWEEKYPARDMGNGKVRGIGVGMAMQGSGIAACDTASVALKVWHILGLWPFQK